jgi:hypothetical protein
MRSALLKSDLIRCNRTGTMIFHADLETMSGYIFPWMALPLHLK